MKNLTKEEKKIAVRVLKAYHEWTKLQFTTVDQFIKEHGLEEFKFEIGKWYKATDSLVCYQGVSDVIEIPTFKGYGFVLEDWIGPESEAAIYEGWSPEADWTEATQDEVFEALRNEAIKRGFNNENVFIPVDLGNNSLSPVIFNGDITYVTKDGSVELMNNQWTIFKDGVWSEVNTSRGTISMLDAIDQPKHELSLHHRVNILENELAELKKLLHENTKD